ncbi:MAG: alpha/beta hydrolase family protein [Cytophagaceae bacterium]
MGNLIKIKNHILRSSNKGKPFGTDILYDLENSSGNLIIFCHGFKGFKDWGYFELMAEYFASEGFIFIKFNYSHNGTTPEQPEQFVDLEAFSENTFSKESVDLEKVIEFAGSSNLIAKPIKNIFLLGHSRGGYLAILKAFQNSQIKGLATLAAVSNFESRYTNEQIAYWKEHGTIYIENSRTGQMMPLKFDIFKDFDENKEKLSVPLIAPKINKPWLIIHGEKDESVPVSHAHDLKKWNQKAQLLILPDANHVFGGSHPYEKTYLPNDFLIACKAVKDFFNSL